MSAKTDFINAKIDKISISFDFSKGSPTYYDAILIEWSRQLVLAELEEWQDGSTPGFKYDNN